MTDLPTRSQCITEAIDWLDKARHSAKVYPSDTYTDQQTARALQFALVHATLAKVLPKDDALAAGLRSTVDYWRAEANDARSEAAELRAQLKPLLSPAWRVGAAWHTGTEKTPEQRIDDVRHG